MRKRKGNRKRTREKQIKRKRKRRREFMAVSGKNDYRTVGVGVKSLSKSTLPGPPRAVL